MKKTDDRASYVLVSVAFNEERQIAQTIECVTRQKLLPKKWIIVDDASTDRTSEIIKSFTRKHPWIQYERLEKPKEPCPTIGKASYAYARAMSRARELLAGMEYEFLANLDADITFDPDYFERVMEKAQADSRLGITGGGAYSVLEDGTVLEAGFIQPDFVGGPLQFFRKQCLDEIDGYHAIDHADVVAVYMARMKGWKVRCYPEIRALHHGQPRDTAREKFTICRRMGRMDYLAGSHPLFMLSRAGLRMLHKPYIIAGISMLIGYFGSAIRGEKRRMPADIAAFMRKDQIAEILVRLRIRKTNPHRAQ